MNVPQTFRVCLACMLMVLSLFAVSLADETGAFPPLTAEGFLPEGSEEFLYEDAQGGVWRYASDTLRVEIFRLEENKPNHVWYEAEVWTKDDVPHMIANDPDKRMTSLAYPYRIARKYQVVLAINSDFAHLRISQKAKAGIILREGQIVKDQGKARNRNQFPNLDTLAIFPDGDMQVFYSDEKTAEEYLEMGARDVLAFGPWLIRDGEINEEGIKKYGTGSAQRTGVGMIEKGHYVFVMVEGRQKGTTSGASIAFVASRLQAKGCQVGFNLDGGQSSAIVFMGKQICTVVNSSGNKASARKAAEILGIGHSTLVAGDDEKMSDQ